MARSTRWRTATAYSPPIAITAPRWPSAASRCGHGRAVRQGHRLGSRSWRLHAPARRRAPLLWRLGHRRRPPADRRRSCARPRAHRSAERVLCQFGDGAVATGAFHEALNLAAVWQLPIVFQVIDNQYGMGTSVDQSAAEPDLWKRAAAYRMHGERIDGNDLMAVREAASPAAPPRPGPSDGRRCSRRSPTGSAATRWPTPARCTARSRGDRIVEAARPDHPLRPGGSRTGALERRRHRRDLARGQRGEYGIQSPAPYRLATPHRDHSVPIRLSEWRSDLRSGRTTVVQTVSVYDGPSSRKPHGKSAVGDAPVRQRYRIADICW